MKNRLIASAPSAKKLLGVIASRYFYDKPERYDLADDGAGSWLLMRDMETLKGYRIIKRQGRFRFESVDE